MRTALAALRSLMVAAGVLVATMAAAQPDVAAALADARKLVDSGQPSAAIAKLRAFEDTSDPRVSELIGAAYYHANEAGNAIATLTPIVDRLPAASLERREAVQVLGL